MATDRFAKSQGPWPTEYLDDPSSSAVAVTPSDATPLTAIPKMLFVGVSGDITMTLAHDSASVLFKAVPVGILRVRPGQVFATGTTATNILALY
jgi:hypothetical protein